MADRVNIVKMAVDSYLGRPNGNYSVSETQACLRDQLIELNGGSAKLDPRSFRRHPELYEVIEEILTVTVNDGLQSDNPMYNFVEEHNVALGDSTEFVIEGNGEFVVSEVAVGTKGLRRERLLGNTVLPVATKAYGAKIYDELQRVLAGKIDLNEMINRLGAAFTKKMNAEILKVTTDAFSQLTTPWQVTGTFDGDKLIDLIDHVEAATGQRATLLTSKQGARAMAKAFNFSAHDAQDEIFGLGYYTHLYDNPIVVMQNAHKPGTTTFELDKSIYVIGADNKFVKHVTRGESLIIDETNSLDMADLSQNYTAIQYHGFAAIMTAQAGKYYLP